MKISKIFTIIFGLIIVISLSFTVHSATVVRVPQGGTGLSSIAEHNLLLGGNSTSPSLVLLPPGTSTYVLTSNGTTTAPSWQQTISAIVSLNGLTTSTQLFATTTIGSDFYINSSGNTHTFNLPDSSSSTRGLLTSSDFTIFYDTYSTTSSKWLNWDTAYTHSQDNSQAHTDYMLNTGDVVTGVYDFGGATSLEIPNGTPTIDTFGEIGIDNTDDQFQFFGTSTKRVIPFWSEKCFTLENATTTDDNVPIWSPRRNITVIDAYCRTSTSTVQVTLSDGTSDMDTITCDTDGQADDGSLTNNTWTSRERMEFDIGTVGTDEIIVNYCFSYTIDSN